MISSLQNGQSYILQKQEYTISAAPLCALVGVANLFDLAESQSVSYLPSLDRQARK